MWYATTGTIPKLEMDQFLRMQKPDQLSSSAKKGEDFLNFCLRKYAAMKPMLLFTSPLSSSREGKVFFLKTPFFHRDEGSLQSKSSASKE